MGREFEDSRDPFFAAAEAEILQAGQVINDRGMQHSAIVVPILAQNIMARH